MTETKLEKAIYLAANMPQGEYDVSSVEVNAKSSPTQRSKSLLWLEWNRYDENENVVIDKDYELLMSSGVEVIRHLLDLLVECRKSVFGAPMSAELADKLRQLDDYEP